MIYSDYQFKVPEEKLIRVITNTDAKNEADDQFAIVHTMLSPKFNNVGYIAAHFGERDNRNTMEESYQELEALFDKMGFCKENALYKGAQHALPDRQTPVDSPGAQLIIAEAMKEDPHPLFVTFMGPLTDLATALLLEPRIAKRLTAIWIGGGAYPDGSEEYNLSNDIHAANVVFESQVELWQVPKNVYEMIPVSFAELEYRLYDKGEIGKYLLNQLVEHAHMPGPRNSSFRSGEAWVLGDNPVVGLMIHEDRYQYDYIRAPYITPHMTYVQTNRNRPIRVYRQINSRIMLEDMFAKIALFHRNYPNGYQKK